MDPTTGEGKTVAETDDAKVKDAKATATKSSEEATNFSVGEFFKGTKEELDKVVWPSRQQVISESVAVILMVTLSATLIYLFDNLFSWAANQVF